MTKSLRIILYLFMAVVGIYYAVVGLAAAQNFLAPLVIAVLLAMLVLPVADKLENIGIARGWAAIWSDLILVLATLVFFFVISAQVKLVADDWAKISHRIEPAIENTLDYIKEKTGVSLDEMFKMPSFLENDQEKSTGKAAQEKESKEETEQEKEKKEEPEQETDKTEPASASQAATDGMSGSALTGSTFSGRELLSGVASSAAGLFGFFGSMILVFIYVFFFLLYRTKLKKSLLKMIPEYQQERASDIVSNSVNVAKGYLVGRFFLIVFLAIFYSTGMLILGVKYALFAGIISAILSLIPYIGNMIGGAISILLALVSGGTFLMALGVLGIFSLAQFIESYLLEPYVVGKQVELNPIIIIIIVIMGEAIWGIMGMVIAIPVTGILKVIFDAIPKTRPLGYLLGNEDISGGDGIFKKMRDKIRKTFKK
ncbi:MAG: AI-2E family transporter [Bacteroidales bacterium]